MHREGKTKGKTVAFGGCSRGRGREGERKGAHLFLQGVGGPKKKKKKLDCRWESRKDPYALRRLMAKKGRTNKWRKDVYWKGIWRLKKSGGERNRGLSS